MSYIKTVKNNAAKREIVFDLTIEQVSAQYEKQSRKCHFSGLPIGFDNLGTKRNRHTASIDRLDSDKGYTADNICIVHKDINKMKNVFSVDQFTEYCRLVANFYPAKSDST